MSAGFVWAMIIGGALITYALRASFVLLMDKITFPPLLERALQYVPAAVITAIVVPALVYQDDTLNISAGNERLLAGLVAAGVAWRTQNILITIVTGMAALWLFVWLGV